MIDIIIPCYNNELGVYTSLFSIGVLNYGQKVYLIDDCSTDDIDYDRIVQFFGQFYQINLIKLTNNVGPGVARQIGIEHSNSDYITFLDCGDIFLPDTYIPNLINILEQNSYINMICPPHLEEYEDYNYNLVHQTNNRMHGKIYRRSFLMKYNIQFCHTSSYANEDIGFNFLCRWICEFMEPDSIFEYDKPVVLWKHDKNSLARKNNYAFFYKNNKGLYLNIKYVFNKLIEYGLDYEILKPKIYYIFCNLYISFIGAVNERPDCLEDSIFGLKNFYNEFMKNIEIDMSIFTQIYFEVMQSCIYTGDFSHPYLRKLNDFNILNLLDKLKKEEI